MSSFRGRTGHQGNVAVQAGAEARTTPNGIVRPAFRMNASYLRPAQAGGPKAGHPLLDLSSVAGWRLVAVAAAIAYVIGFHVTIGRTRLGLGPAR